MDANRSPSFTLLRGGYVYAPAELGLVDVLLFGSRVVAVGADLQPPSGSMDTKVLDLSGLLVVPGLIDGHCHPTGAGGVSGPETRSPELTLTSLLLAGITTVVGVLGGDGLTRQPLELLARVRGLRRQGVSAFMLLGAYRVPPPTISGDLQRDVYILPECLGAGEIAVNDERGSQPSLEELARIVADANIGGRLAGKKGITNLHLGTGKGGLELLRRLRDETDLPADLLIPTHLNRSELLLHEAIDWCRSGGVADLTASLEDHLPGTVPVATAVKEMLEAGVEPRQITVSTDAGGVFPVADEHGERRLHRWSSSSLLEGVRRIHFDGCTDLPATLAMASTNAARNLGIAGKGSISPGYDADLLVLDRQLERVTHLWARGRQLVADGSPLVRGPFEDE